MAGVTSADIRAVIDKIRSRIQQLETECDEAQAALRVVERLERERPAATAPKRPSTKNVIIEVLSKAPSDGLRLAAIQEAALSDHQQDIQINTISTNLGRLKRAGIVSVEKKRWFLVQKPLNGVAATEGAEAPPATA